MKTSISTRSSGPDDSGHSFQTHDIDECKEYFRAQEGIPSFHTAHRQGFRDFHHRQWVTNGVSLNLIRMFCAEDFTVSHAKPASFFQFNFLLKGSCNLKGEFGDAVAKPGDTFIVDPDSKIMEYWDGSMVQFLLRIDRRLIESKLSTELGRGLRQGVTFEPVMRDPGIASWLHHIMDEPWDSGETVLGDHRVAKCVADTLTTMVLAGFRHSETDNLQRLPHSAAPYYVKRAEEFIHANALEDIEVEQIAHQAGVSLRTLFYGFKRWRGTTPMAYVRDAKLDIARRELEQNKGGRMTVSCAAINAGFTNFSQFSRIYKERFGETPSKTLLRR